MAYIGVMTRKGTCAICAKGLPVGENVYHDPSKDQGSHLVHTKCWEDLKESRKGSIDPYEKKKKPSPKLSTEPLDAPF